MKNKISISVVKNCAKVALAPVIKGKILDGSIIYQGVWKTVERLILNS